MTVIERIVGTIARRAAALEDALVELMMADSLSAYRIGFVLLLLVVAATCTLMFLMGAVPQRDGAWDSVAILEGGWRLAQGLKPHTDYFDLFGVTSYLPPLLGIWMVGCKSEALAYGPAVLLPVMALWSWNVARRRFPAVPSLLIATFVGGLVIGAFPLGYAGWLTLGHQMQYNRFQWSIVCLLVLLVFVDPRDRMTRVALAWEGTSAGLLGGFLLAGKLSYAISAVLLLLGGLAMGRAGNDRKPFWRNAIATLLATIALYLFYTRADLKAYWSDVSIVLAAQRSGDRFRGMALLLKASWRELLTPCFIAVIYLRRIFASDRPLDAVRGGLRCLLAAGFLVGMGIVITATNTQLYDIPLCALASVILAEVLQRPAKSADVSTTPVAAVRSEADRLRVFLGYGAAAIALLCFIIPDYGSVAYAFAWKKVRSRDQPEDARFACSSLASMICPPTTYDPVEIEAIRKSMLTSHRKNLSQFEFAIYVNEGLKLLQGRYDKDSRIAVYDFCNPFPVALQLPVARGSPIGWILPFVLDEHRFVPANVALQNVTHVMVPKKAIVDVALQFGERVCGPYVHEHFEKAAESSYWTLYVRKPERDAAP